MEDKEEETGMNSFPSSATELNLKYISSKTDDFSKWPSLAVESSFSYVANSEKNNRTRKVPGASHQYKQGSTPQNGISTVQGVNTVVNSQYKTVTTTERKAKNVLDKDKQDSKSDLLLTGKRLQMSPEFWRSDHALRSRSGSESECRSTTEDNRFNPGLYTFPPPNISSLYTNEVNPGSNAMFLNINRHRLPAFSPRLLGQSWVGCAERQRSWAQETKAPLDNILTSGVRQPLRTRQRVPPHRYSPSAHLRRTSSHESVKTHIPRTRSASLPVASKLHDSRMVMEWNEKRTGGVTYVTPVLSTLSDGDLSCYSSLKTEDKTFSHTTQHSCVDDV